LLHGKDGGESSLAEQNLAAKKLLEEKALKALGLLKSGKIEEAQKLTNEIIGSRESDHE
jgi:hypothetical protein